MAVLYEAEIGKTNIETSMAFNESFTRLSDDLQDYARTAIQGIAGDQKAIDKKIQAKLHDWDLGRMATIDRNLLRLGVFELYHCPDVPPKVTLDEAIEIAKKYSTAESGKFVNGVLAAVLADSPKANWEPPIAEEDLEAPPEPEPEAEVVEVNEDAPELQEMAKVGKWKLLVEDPPS